MADTPWNSIDPLPAGKNQDIELLVKSNGANYREKAEQIMQAFSGLGTVDGSCTSAIDAEEKTVTLSEYTLNVLPREFSVTFTNANTYGNGTTTYPILKVYNSNNQLLGSLPAANSRGRYAGNGAWEAGDILYFRVMADRACIINSEISTTRDLQARVKDMTLSALDLTEANKTLPVNSSAVDGALGNYNKVASFSFASKKYLELFRFSNTEMVYISGGIGYSATFGTIEFDLTVNPSGFYGSYINKTGNANFGLYLQKISDAEFVCYASGYDWANIRFTCSKRITTLLARDTLEGTEIKKLVTETLTNSVLTNALTTLIEGVVANGTTGIIDIANQNTTLYKQGIHCELSLSVNVPSITSSNWYVIGNVPEGFRPRKRVWSVGINRMSNTPFVIIINPASSSASAGNIEAYITEQVSNGQLKVNCSYYV